MKEYNLFLMGGWGLNIAVEANSKDEALEYAKKRAEEMSVPLDLSIEEYWIEGEDNGELSPNWRQLRNQSFGRFSH